MIPGAFDYHRPTSIDEGAAGADLGLAAAADDPDELARLHALTARLAARMRHRLARRDGCAGAAAVSICGA